MNLRVYEGPLSPRRPASALRPHPACETFLYRCLASVAMRVAAEGV